MKREEEYYEKWLDKLKTTQPVLDHPDELTAAIMQRVSRESKAILFLPSSGVSLKKSKMLVIGTWVSVMVAGLLLCLLVGETLFSPVAVPIEKRGLITLRVASLSLPDDWERMNKTEKSRYVSYICHLKELQRTKKERALEKIGMDQTKIAAYEKE